MGGSYYSFPCSIHSTEKDFQIFYDHVNPAIRQTIDQSGGGKLLDRNSKESCALLEDLALYDNESWNDPRDFTKLVKAISLPQDVLSTSDRRLIELENQVQCLMEAHLAPKQHVQVNEISFSWKICSGPHDAQHCMENPKQAFVNYASSRSDEVGGTKQEPSSPKCIHFINSIIILIKEGEAKEEGMVKPNAAECNNHKRTVEAKEEVGEKSEEELKDETEEETKKKRKTTHNI
ncbi:hypothetical protein Tco_0355494 [Tanacetum coccineum]